MRLRAFFFQEPNFRSFFLSCGAAEPGRAFLKSARNFLRKNSGISAEFAGTVSKSDTETCEGWKERLRLFVFRSERRIRQ
jgi:hypothetical protein